MTSEPVDYYYQDTPICLFCGSEQHVSHIPNIAWYIECEECGATGPSAESKDDAFASYLARRGMNGAAHEESVRLLCGSMLSTIRANAKALLGIGMARKDAHWCAFKLARATGQRVVVDDD